MGLFKKVSDKEILETRNNIFCNNGIPALKKNKFEESPFSTAWFGKNNLGDYTYELCRLSKKLQLEVLTIHISSGDEWIKVFLNVFQLNPNPSKMDDLNGLDGLQYSLPPNSLTKMRLRNDDQKGPPLFNMFLPEHKLKSFNSQSGLEKRAEELGALIEKDMQNIDSFVKRWHELHTPKETDWEGIVNE